MLTKHAFQKTATPSPPAVVLQNGDSLDTTTSDESNQGPINGKTIIDEDTTTSFTDNSPPSLDQENEETNDSVVSESTKDSIVSEDSNSLGDYTKRPLEEDSIQPSSKRYGRT
ncbi:hypothetical protein NQ318_016678 [Aromia moschata]|uniref:Uncharacterized protein n=1 Tax=Aromia moschata TaxID=1265417 RepID=A0AAV8Y228_9CUCU|nr:hypothetical protein NQ318_016678 [Aromia moschata]